jgi:hypothetical protein
MSWQTEHLRLLEGAHAAVGRGHEHAHTLLAAHRVLGGAAGIAAGRAEDVELRAAAAELVLEQVAQQLHRHVLEGERGAVGQRLEVHAVFELAQRHDLVAAEHLDRVRLRAERLQFFRRDVVDVERQDLVGQLGVR